MNVGTQDQCTESTLRQYQSLLTVSEVIATQRDLSSLFKQLTGQLSAVVTFDMVATVLYDPVRNLMCIQMRESPLLESVPLPAGLPVEASPSGWVMQTQQPLIIPDTEAADRFPALVKLARQSGLRSYCFLPLTAAGRRLGALAFGRIKPSAFDETNLKFLQQVANQVAIAVDNALNFGRARSMEEELARRLAHLRLMLKITNTVVAQLDLQELLRAVAASISATLSTDSVGIALFEPESGQLRIFTTEYPAGHPLRERGVPIPLEGTPSGLAFTTGQPIFLDNPDLERFPAAIVQRIYEAGYQSGGSIPLVAQGRKLGILGVASKRENAFSDEDKALLIQVANQVAIAVDNALNFTRARQAEQEVKRQLEREHLMLEINNAVVSNLGLPELLSAIAASLRRVLPHDFTGMALYDEELGQLRVQALDSARNQELFGTTELIPLKGTGAGKAFTTRKTIRLHNLKPGNSSIEMVQTMAVAGFKSSCHVPLIVRDQVLGTLDVLSLREEAFTEDDAELLTQIGGQIAIAVENALNFERARKAEQEITRQFERERLMLEINNAVVSQLDLRNLVQVISDRLRNALQLAIAGVSLYDPEAGCLRAYYYDLPDKMTPIELGTPLPLKGSIAGLTFTSGQPVLLNRPEQADAFPISKRLFFQTGINSGGCVPLIVQGRKLGVLGVDSYQPDAFPEERKQLLCQIADQLALAVDNALAYREIETLKNKLSEEKLYLEEEINTAYNFEEVIGSSPALKRILKQVATVAPTDSTVLIQGETGTGKELIARAIHNLSSRRERTLVKLNCAAIPSGLLESELFGHERGAFTGAIAQRIGRFELANKGTLFLDEVGEIPLDLQPKLLRVLQEQEFERLGNARTQKVDVRLIAATNRDLAQMSAENKYRSDLYYRLNVFPITIPPLRERHGDIPLLVRFFANKFALRMKKQIKTIPAESIAVLQQYQWPGNIRELENMIERAVILTQGAELQIPLPEIKVSAKPAVTASAFAPSPPPESDSLEAIERDHILRVLTETNWMVGGPNGAAARLGMKRTTLQARIKKLGITRY